MPYIYKTTSVDNGMLKLYFYGIIEPVFLLNYSAASIIWSSLATGLIVTYQISEIVRITEVPTLIFLPDL